MVTTDSAWLNDLYLRVKCFPTRMHEVTDGLVFWHPTPPPSHWYRTMKRIPCETQKPQMGYQFLLPFPILFKLRLKRKTGLPPTVWSKLEILTSHSGGSSVCDRLFMKWLSVKPKSFKGTKKNLSNIGLASHPSFLTERSEGKSAWLFNWIFTVFPYCHPSLLSACSSHWMQV